jgi:hypothetical protein
MNSSEQNYKSIEARKLSDSSIQKIDAQLAEALNDA